MMKKSILFSCILLFTVFFPVTSCKTTPPAQSEELIDPDKLPPDQDLLSELDTAIARAAKAKENAAYLRGHVYFPDEFKKAEADNENGRKAGRSTVEDTKNAISSFGTAAQSFEEIAENSRPLYEKDLADARVELEQVSVRADLSRKSAIDNQGYLYFPQEWMAAEALYQECFETAPEEVDEVNEANVELPEEEETPNPASQPEPEAVEDQAVAVEEQTDVVEEQTDVVEEQTDVVEEQAIAELEESIPVVIEKPNRDLDEGLVMRGTSANATYDEIKAISAEFFSAVDMFDEIAEKSAPLYAEDRENARKNLQEAAAKAEQSRKDAQNNQANVYFANEWRETEGMLQSGKNAKPNTIEEINATKELFVSTADKYDDLAAKSLPLAEKAAAEKSLNTASARAEKSRQGAMAVGGQTYFPNDWKNAETKNTSAKNAKKTTAEEINAAVALFNQAADSYDDIAKKSGPRFTKDRDDSSKALQAAIARMDQSRKQASDAGGQANFPTEWKNAETKNQNAKNAKRATPAEMKAAAGLYSGAADSYDDIVKKGLEKTAQTAKTRAEKERQAALELKANTASRDDFNKADAIFTQAQKDFTAKSFAPAAQKYTQAADQFAAASQSIESKRTLAEEAINNAKELSAKTKSQAMDAGFNEEDIETSQYFSESTNLIAQADKNMSESQFDDAFKNAEEAVKNLNLFDSYIAQMAPDRMTDDKVTDEGDYLAETPAEPVVEPVLEGTPAEPVIAETPTLAAQYRVLTWVSARDCFWNIAAKPQVYNDPWQWRRLYEANRSKLRNQNNPDILTPGMILDIPSIRGEVRSGILNE